MTLAIRIARFKRITQLQKMPFPLIKLASLFLKQLSKPMANGIKKYAKEHKIFRTICMKPAQWHHHFEVVWKNELLGFGNRTKPRVPLDEDKAVELGAEIIGEAFLYTFGASLLFAEYWYSSKAAGKKESDQKIQIKDMERKINELLLDTDTTNAQLREMQRLLYSVEESNTKLQERLDELTNAKKKSRW